MKKISILLFTAAFTLGMCAPAFASFSDLGSGKWDWARDAIDQMVSSGIVKGYDDNTFRPDQHVTKGEAIVLAARVNGYVNKDSQAFTDLGVSANLGDIQKYDTRYKNEAAYLVYTGVLSGDLLDRFLADSTQPLQRYEAAILLTKLLGGDAEIKVHPNAAPSFADASLIPDGGAPYVWYVSKNDIMKGVDDRTFSPTTSVTRAQIATLLYRVMPKLNYQFKIGTVKSVDFQKKTVSVDFGGDVSDINVNDSVRLTVDGKASGIEGVLPGADANVVFSSGTAVRLEVISPKLDSSLTGIFKKYERLNGQTIITLEIDGKSRTAPVSDGVSVLYNGKPSSLQSLLYGDTIVAGVKDNLIISIDAQSKDVEVKGTVAGITLQPSFQMVINKDTGDTEQFDVADNVSVSKNGKKSSLSEVYVGDSVTATVTYGKISAISATSTSSTDTGVLNEINISASPSIVLKDSAGNSKKYSVARDISIMRDNKKSTIYDLRLGDTVKVSLQSGTVVELNVQSSPERSTITGIVEYINTSYGYVKLTGIDTLVFTSKAKFVDNNGNSKGSRDLAVGSSISAFGTSNPGGFDATLIIIN